MIILRKARMLLKVTPKGTKQLLSYDLDSFNACVLGL